MTTISPLPQRRKFPTRKLLLERKLILLADEKKPNSPVFRPNTIEIRGVDLATRLRYSVSYYVPGFLRLSTWSWFDFDTPRESVLSPTHGGSKVFIRLAFELRKIPFVVSITRYLNRIDSLFSFLRYFFSSCCVFFG